MSLASANLEIEREPPPARAVPLTIIEPRSGWRFVDLRELWLHRELLYFLVWRDIKVRYKQTALGIAWAVIQPASVMVVFSLFFGRLAEMATGRIPYPLFVFAGILPWSFFSNAVVSAANSLVSNQNLITKVYFPRLLIPLGAVAGHAVDFLIGCGVLGLLMAWYGFTPSWQILLLPLLALWLVVVAAGFGIFLAALTVAYRDVRHAIPFVVQLWMFATPAIYMKTFADLNPRWGIVLPLNPLDGLVTNFRAALLGTELNLYALSVSVVIGLLALVLGSIYFRRVERSFADII